MTSSTSRIGSLAGRRVIRGIGVVIGLGLGGTALFGLVHAVLIAPIWTRLAAGIPFALLASLLLLWSYSALRSEHLLSAGSTGGAVFGAMLWLSLVPVTLLGAYIRHSSLRPRLGQLEPAVELAVAAASGALLGATWRGSRRVALALASCVTGLVLVMAGPIAIGHAVGRLLFVAFLPIYVLAGIALASVAPNPPAGQPLRGCA
jgi:hypothetical protein